MQRSVICSEIISLSNNKYNADIDELTEDDKDVNIVEDEGKG